ncbi:MAG TPA: aspartate-alanine antiporter [Vicinamibacteria bacterium]|nr:aspartate-alanine antiporter [Vicinamibacteria bacterium]
MTWFVTSLRENPELAIFLTLAIGFLIGRIRVAGFSLGNVVGTLLAGVLVGQLEVKIDPLVKVVFFDLFLFATGYKVGPQFFRGLKKNAASQALLTAVLCVVSLATTIAAAKLMGYDCGTAAGLLAGAFTESTVIGTAGNTIARLALPEAEKTRLLNNIPVAYAVSYLVGTSFVVWFLSSLAPRLLRVDLKEESRKLEAEGAVGSKSESGTRSAYREWDVRAFRVPEAWGGNSVAAVEGSFAPARVFVQRIRRGPAILEAAPDTVLQPGDVAVVGARRQVLLAGGTPFGEEAEDRELLDFPMATVDVVVTRKDVAERPLADIAGEHGRGIVLQKLVRGGEEIPFAPGTLVNRGDLLRLAGAERDVERAGQALGYVERPSSATDVVFVGLGILVGGLLGALTLRVGDLPLSLTASGGALVMGLVFGWLRSVRPTFGRIPEPALWVFDTIGLAVFIGCVGLGAGPSFVAGLRTTGTSLVVVGLLVALTPHLSAVLFGRYVLKMNPVLLLGACSGAGTATAALRAVQDEAASKLPVLGYTVPYAIGNILLTAWGPVIVMLTR